MASSNSIHLLQQYALLTSILQDRFHDFLPRLSKRRLRSETERNEAGMYLCYWFASLYVVVEGWQKLGLHDPDVDKLLASPNVEFLREYRDGIFRFDENFLDGDAMGGSIPLNQKTVSWAEELYDAFVRYLNQWEAVTKCGAQQMQ